MLETITSINDSINGVVWGMPGLILLIGTGILMTLVTKVFQVGHLKHWWKNTIGSLFKKNVIGHTKEKGAISAFQALCTALAATVGTGNIAGVAAAICLGGPGAVFWMWVAAFFGMMTNYSENVLGMYFRRKNRFDEWSGGAMYYLQDGLGKLKGCKWVGKILAIIFSVFTMFAAFGIGSMGQVNKIVANVVSAFEFKALSEISLYTSGDSTITLYHLLIGIIVLVLTAIITLGGLKRIANVAEKIVPVMIVLFIIGGVAIVAINYDAILPALKSIFAYAFTAEAIGGGGVGIVISKVMTQGFKRGVFSNEAGLGSSVMVHSNSNVKEPVKQGMWGIFEVFADTMVVCTMTALVILTSGVYQVGATGLDDATLVGAAFNTILPWGGIGAKFVAVAMFLFAFTTILGWSHYGAKAWEYLFGAKSTIVFKIIHVITILFGAILTSSLAWDISDTFNGLMMIPNLIGVVVLFPLVMKITKNYVDRKIKGKDEKPMLSYDPEIQAQHEATLSDEE